MLSQEMRGQVGSSEAQGVPTPLPQHIHTQIPTSAQEGGLARGFLQNRVKPCWWGGGHPLVPSPQGGQMQCGFGPLSASALLSPGPSCSWRVERSVAPAWFSLHRSPGLVGTSSLTLTLSPTPTLLPHQAASTWDHRATEHGGLMYPGHPPLGRVQSGNQRPHQCHRRSHIGCPGVLLQLSGC